MEHQIRNRFAILSDLLLGLPIYLTSVGGWSNQDKMIRKQGYADFHWIQTISGQGELVTEGQTFTVNQGQGMLLFPDIAHTYYATKEPWEVSWVTFNGKYARSILRAFHWENSQILTISNPLRLLHKMDVIYSLTNSKDTMDSLDASSKIYEVLLDLHVFGSASEVRSKQQHIEHLSPVLNYIDDQYAQPIALSDLASLLSVSPQHVCVLFQQTLGMRPFEYITKQRLRKAKELLLKQTEMEISQIAQNVGYSDASYFIKLFKQQEGLTPKVFRSTHIGLPS
ncbi:AraC family transcriptional regulator [Paenibacillus psychroresistens]|uniref:AraC family transcriptional regulator n=1 Tax=Paenibacillus psychroresistens TaxID=1778678 RepID=A0A6B8RDS1_9BACL|nr:AraC family transcriptional regulator [Paenibacillus psychroresistens]QGQ94067.1 AraC family transcriptional regulator [Paenibacillus psychroresistens]